MDTSGLCSERTPGGGADESHPKDFAIPEPTTSSGCSEDAAARAGDEAGCASGIEGTTDLQLSLGREAGGYCPKQWLGHTHGVTTSVSAASLYR